MVVSASILSRKKVPTVLFPVICSPSSTGQLLAAAMVAADGCGRVSGRQEVERHMFCLEHVLVPLDPTDSTFAALGHFWHKHYGPMVRALAEQAVYAYRAICLVDVQLHDPAYTNPTTYKRVRQHTQTLRAVLQTTSKRKAFRVGLGMLVQHESKPY